MGADALTLSALISGKLGLYAIGNVSLNMEKGPHPISDLVTDKYAGKILSLTFSQPRCVQEICELTGIPVAVAYRRVAALEGTGLIRCQRTEMAPSGRKSKFYLCQVDMVRLTFREGHFEVEIEWKDHRSERHLPVIARR
jgi:predicted transcriptional regulator